MGPKSDGSTGAEKRLRSVMDKDRLGIQAGMTAGWIHTQVKSYSPEVNDDSTREGQKQGGTSETETPVVQHNQERWT